MGSILIGGLILLWAGWVIFGVKKRGRCGGSRCCGCPHRCMKKDGGE